MNVLKARAATGSREFVRLLARRRALLALKQHDVAQRLGCTRQYVVRALGGSVDLCLSTALAIAEALELRIVLVPADANVVVTAPSVASESVHMVLGRNGVDIVTRA